MAAPAREAEPQAVETQAEPAAPGTAAGVVELLAMSTPEAVLALQRTAGNQAVTRLIQRDPDPTADAKAAPGGGEYEFKIEGKFGERAAGSFRVAISKSNANPLVAKTEGGDAKVQLGATKQTWEAGKGLATAMTAALGKADLTIAEPWPGITLKAELKALEAKVEAGDVDVNVFKIAVLAEGVLTKALRATELGQWVADNSPFGELLLEGATIKVQFRGEINVDPSDAVRLARLAKLNGQIAKNAAEVVKINDKIADLRRQNDELSKLLKKRGAKKGEKLAKRIAANKKKIADATKKLASTKKAGQVLMKASAEAAKGLKSKAGRLVGLAVKKIGGKLLLRLVPGLNIALAVLDVVTVGKAIYDLATGKARIGLPTGEEGEGGEGGGEGTGGEGAADAGAPAGDASGADGGESTTAPDPDALPPEIEIESIMSEPAEEAAPELEANAQAVVDELEASSSEGAAAMGPADLEQLNEVCRDLTPEELAQILEGMSATEGKEKATDAFAVLAEIVRRKQALRAAASQTTVEDESGTHVLVDPETPVPDSPDVAAGKATGKGPAGTGGKEEGGAGPSLSETEPLTDVPEGSSTTMTQFRIVSGYSTETKYAKGSTFSITAEFSGDGRTHLVSFTIKVDSRTEDAKTITLKAHNAVGWKVKDGAIYMPAGAPVEITSTKE